MRLFKNISGKLALALAVISAGMVSCNEKMPLAEPIPNPSATGSTIADLVTADTSYSFLLALINRAGLTSFFASRDNNMTVFAPNNNAFRLSGIPSTAVINGLPVATAQALVNYHLIPGEQFTAARITTAFPNVQLPSNINLLAPYVKLSLFPSRRSAGAWVNQIPITATDIKAANGVVHSVAAVLNPPATTLLGIAAADTNFQFLVAAIVRADSGVAAGSRLQDALNNPLASLTVFAPVNNAFRAVFVALGLPPETSSFNFIPVSVVRGIVAFHVLGVRAFSPNLPLGDSQVPTLIGPPPNPQLQLRVSSTSVQARGAGNVVPGTTTQFYANVTTANVHAINGVIHVVNAVLLPLPL
jgi:transforming growth factor-beta-induced protein